MKSTKLLMADHGRILVALCILDSICTEIEHEKEVNYDDIHSLLAFLYHFADGSHHVKEEGILFPALMQAEMTLAKGPLRVMTYEHKRGRALTSAMENSLSRSDRRDFLMYARRYIQLLTEHIEKENYVLLMAEDILSDDEDQKIAKAFTEFEQTTVGTPTYDGLRGMLESLGSKYLDAAPVLG